MDYKLKARFLSLYSMILADGIIDAREMETLYRIGREEYGISQKEIDLAIKESGTPFHCPEDLPGKISFLYQMSEIALADNQLDNSERSLICKYAKRMGFIEENINDIVDYLLQQAKAHVPVSDVIDKIMKEE